MRYEDLEVWKRSTQLSVLLYRNLSDLKDWGFRDQVTRSGLSIPSNIAEGYERDSTAEVIRFLKIAKGSAGELATQIYIGSQVGYISEQNGSAWSAEAKEISRMLGGLIQFWKTKLP